METVSQKKRRREMVLGITHNKHVQRMRTKAMATKRNNELIESEKERKNANSK
jgi:hypothetical protein